MTAVWGPDPALSPRLARPFLQPLTPLVRGRVPPAPSKGGGWSAASTFRPLVPRVTEGRGGGEVRAWQRLVTMALGNREQIRAGIF